MFEWQKRYQMADVVFAHKLHIFEPTCNVLFIIWRQDVIEIADFYFIVFEKSSFTYHRSPSQKIQSTHVQDIETLTEFQSNKIHEIFVN